jgi:hypothetical protein
MYLIAHETLRTQWQQPIMFKRGNQWVQTNPAQWQVRDSVEVNLGKAANERARESNVLSQLLDRQAFLASQGMEDILVDVTTYHAALNEWLRVNDIENPDRFMIDPRSEKAGEAMQRKAQQAQQQSQKQEAMVMQAIALEQIRTALEKYRIDVETQFKYYSEVLGAQIEEAKITASAVVDLRKAVSESRRAAQSTVSNSDDNDSRGTKASSASAQG